MTRAVSTPAAIPQAAAREGETRAAVRLLRLFLRAGVRLYLLVLATATRIGPRQRPAGGTPQDILLTLNFHAAGWPRALLAPLQRSPQCGRLRLVTSSPVDGLDGIDVIQAPAWLRRLCGATLARLALFAWTAIRTRPEVVGGVHLLFNGLVATLAARICGARALYICVGGPNEVAGGGLWSENRVFGRLTAPDPVLERLLLRAATSCDTIVTMGTSAATYFNAHGARSCHVIPSGVDTHVFQPANQERDVDVLLVARLVPLKRIDLFVDTVARIAVTVPQLTAIIIGRGPMLESARARVETLGIGDRVSFLGHEPDVSTWYRRAKVFLLTSDTEGVSISLIEAMLSGAVPVVSDVGDLPDVVDDGDNGFLIEQREPVAFAGRVTALLTDPELRARMSQRARERALEFDPAALAPRWGRLLAAGAAISNREEALING